MARLLLLLLLLAACSSGEGVEAPKVLAPDEDDGACPSGDAVLVSLKSELNSGAFDELRPTLETVLVDNAGLKTQLAFLSAILPDLSGDELKTLLSILQSDDGHQTVDAFKPHVINVLEYMHGTSPFLPGKHLEPIAAGHEILTSCDAAEQMANIRNILALEVRRTPPGSDSAFEVAAAGEGDSSFLFALLIAIDTAADVPAFRGLLERLEIEEEPEGGGGDIVVGRQAFIVLAKLLAANIAAPDFQFAPTRQLLEDVLVPRLEGDAQAEAALDELLDLMGLLVEADSQTFEGMQAFMGCVNRHDEEAAIPGMLFDYLTIDELPLDDLLDDVVDSTSLPTAGDLRNSLVQILDAVLLHGDLLGDATQVIVQLLDPSVADTTLGTVLSLKGKGVLTELQDFLEVLVTCKGVEL